VSKTFIFGNDGKLLAKNEDIDAETATHAAHTITALSKRANAIGGLESATFYCISNNVSFFHINNYYLCMVSPGEQDGKNAAAARILIPTVLRLTEEFCSDQEENFRTEKPELSDEKTLGIEELGTDLEPEETPVRIEPLDEESEPEPEPEPLLPEPPVTQFMVENLGGLLVASDTVRIDNGVIQQWKDLYGKREIEEVDVEALNGQTTRCRFKPIKGSKYEGKGMIQLPQKVQRTLRITKGELVMVKPAIE
jgi:hypothetical protein